jgi:hypothetical protein
LVESVVLCVTGGAPGLTLAFWGLGPLKMLIPPGMPRVDDITVDFNVVGFTILISVALGCVIGLVPAWQARRLSLTETLRESSGGSPGGKGRSHTRSVLVVVEVATAVTLLVAATLLATSYMKMQAEGRGFETEFLLTARLTLLEHGFQERHQVLEFYRQLLENVAALPSVVSVGLSSNIPFSGTTSVSTFTMSTIQCRRMSRRGRCAIP